MFTIEDAKRVQRDFNLGDQHVAYVDPGTGWFVLAHTDAERGLQALSPLAECYAHRWLARSPMPHGFIEMWGCCFPESGWYVIPGIHEARGLAL